MFVQKNSNHRGIKIEKLEDLDLDKKGSFVQEFIHDPFLVDGYKFDIGVYTMITSIDPLRIYVYNGYYYLNIETVTIYQAFLAFFSKLKDQNFKTQPNLWQNSRILFSNNDVISSKN